MTAKEAKPITNGRNLGRLRMIEFHFFGMPIKTLGSLGKIRVGRETGNTHMFWAKSSQFAAEPRRFCGGKVSGQERGIAGGGVI